MIRQLLELYETIVMVLQQHSGNNTQNLFTEPPTYSSFFQFPLS
jgi:hypothetical protein